MTEEPLLLDVGGSVYMPMREPNPSNPQLFANNPDLVSEYASLQTNGEALHGQRPPNLAITHEKPEHYIIVFLKANGYSNREVAAKTGYSEPWVSQICRQPWFLKKLMLELRTAGRDATSKFLEVQKDDSLIKLVVLRDGAKSEAVQLAATNSLLDRFLGKPVQKTEVKLEGTANVVHRHEELREELSDLDRREAALRTQLHVIPA